MNIQALWNQDNGDRAGSCTLGAFTTEEESALCFDSVVNRLSDFGLWRIEKEVPGTYMNCLPLEERQQCRIDRLLIPQKKLSDAGWRFGPIGIEIKRSREKLGGPASQCIDYRNAIFQTGAGTQFVLQQVFLWPLLFWGGGELESVMAQRRIGGVFHERQRMRFCLGQQSVLDISDAGLISNSKFEFVSKLGRKKGSRSNSKSY